MKIIISGQTDHPKTSSRPKRRFTIVASNDSYQPQTENKELIEITNRDILDLFNPSPHPGKGFICKEINSGILKNIENYILEKKKIELRGTDLFKLRSMENFESIKKGTEH